MSTDDPYLVWMANKVWEDHGTDRRLARGMQQHARILWVDPPISPATPRRRCFGATRAPWPKLTAQSDRITRLTTTALPGMTRFGVRATTAPLIRAQVRWALRRMDITPFAVVTTNFHDVLGRWGDGVVSALHGTDDFVAGADLMRMSADRLRMQERTAVLKADVVTALSPILAERWSALRGAPVQVIPNGCTLTRTSFDHVPKAVMDLPRPVVGLIGRLNARINMDLVEAIADAGFSLVIVGPHDEQWEPARFRALTARPRVLYVGRVPEDEALDYVAATDVGITPYLDSPFNRASFPLKTLDYLSAGRPMVSTDLPAARWLLDDLTHSEPGVAPEQILALAGNRADFIKAVRQLVSESSRPDRTDGGYAGPEPAHAARCRAFAERHSWSRRADALAAAIGLTVGSIRTGSEHARTM
jgi:teichuronic acid biosynthesis glycosyltransferase TuaH